jgi:hypothetical protein
MATVNEDFLDMLDALSRHEVDFLVVGAYALAAHGCPRATGDIDLLVRPDLENARRVYSALLDFGAPVQAHGITELDFASTGVVYQLGLPPNRIDLLTSISGVDYATASTDALSGNIGSVAVRFIGRSALLMNKRAAGRTKDIADAEWLEGSG